MRRFMSLLVFLALPTLSACGGVHEVTDGESRLESLLTAEPIDLAAAEDYGLFAFSPPPGLLWERQALVRPAGDGFETTFVHVKFGPLRTTVAVLAVFRLPREMAARPEQVASEVLRLSIALHRESDRYTIVRSATQAQPRWGPKGSEYRLTIRDRGAPDAPPEGLAIEIQGVYCSISPPRGGTWLINLDYSERGWPGDLVGFEARAGAVLDRLALKHPPN